MSDWDDDRDAPPRRPTWVRVVALVAAAALVVPIVVSAVDLVL